MMLQKQVLSKKQRNNYITIISDMAFTIFILAITIWWILVFFALFLFAKDSTNHYKHLLQGGIDTYDFSKKCLYHLLNFWIIKSGDSDRIIHYRSKLI